VAHAEASARTVEAAVTAAAAELGLRPDQVDVEVLEDPVPSTFGYIGSPARVRVTPRTPTPASRAPSTPAPSSAPQLSSSAAGPRAPSRPGSSHPDAAGTDMGVRHRPDKGRQGVTRRDPLDPDLGGSVPVGLGPDPGHGGRSTAEQADGPDAVEAIGSDRADEPGRPLDPVHGHDPAAAPARATPPVPARAASPGEDAARSQAVPPGESAARTRAVSPGASAAGEAVPAGSSTTSGDTIADSTQSAVGTDSPDAVARSGSGPSAQHAGQLPTTATEAPPSQPAAALAASAGAPIASGTPSTAAGAVGDSVPSGVPEAVAAATGTDAPAPAPSAEPSRTPRHSRRTLRDEPIDPAIIEADTERAGDFLEGLLDALDVDGDITTWVDEAGGHVDLEGSDLNMLIGSNGETLDALQELTRLAVLRQAKRRVRLLLDINGFRARQREQLVSVVRATAEKVIRSREDHEFEPMTPAERKIIHDAVAAIDGVTTESLGEEPNRRVIIQPT
jgi:spoIIIJ-associated protein